MSAASQILTASADALAAGHDDDLLLLPVGVVVSGHVNQANDPAGGGRGIQQLHITEELPTHIVSVRRWKILTADVDPKAVAAIRLGDKTYRVRHFTNDAAIPCLEFFCTLS